jgi:hypothetical protein
VELIQLTAPSTAVNITFFVAVKSGALSFEVSATKGLARMGAVYVEKVDMFYPPSSGGPGSSITPSVVESSVVKSSVGSSTPASSPAPPSLDLCKCPLQLWCLAGTTHVHSCCSHVLLPTRQLLRFQPGCYTLGA